MCPDADDGRFCWSFGPLAESGALGLEDLAVEPAFRPVVLDDEDGKPEGRGHEPASVPPARRRYGYFCLPVLAGEELIARVDLKADRANDTMLVQAVWAEDGIDHDEVATELAAELADMAGWLGLGHVEIVGPGNLAPALAAVMP